MNNNKNELNILAIDTSSKICGVAVKANKNRVVYNENTGYQHEEILFVKIEQCLKKAKVDIKDIQKIAVSNGPGSYTGLRIGVVCALGLSVNNNIPIVYIDTLAQLAYSLKEKYDYIDLNILGKNITDINQINEKIVSAKEELFNLRFQQATGTLEKPSRIRDLRHEVARLKTVLRERELEGENK